MADSINIDLGVVKALSKEKRQWLASEIRKDSELWSAVNGMGGLSENSEKSRLQGTVTNNSVAVVGVKVSIVKTDTNKEFTAITNQKGYYSIDLEPANYTVKLASVNSSKKGGGETEVETISGETSTLNFDDNIAETENTSNETL